MDKSNIIDNSNDTSKLDKRRNKLIEEEKIIVKKQIDELKKLISDIELQIELISYGECEIIKKSSSSRNDSNSDICQNINDILQYELYKMAGFYCSKFVEDEFVFNFSSSSNIKSPCAIQIFTKNDNVELGGWVMPWGITIDKILSETPLQHTKDIISLLKNCKHHIDCHAERKKQFEELKEYTSSIKNIEVDTTLGYTSILCHFYHVHDKLSDKKFNLTVTIHYNNDRVRPNSINIEWNLKEKLTEQISIDIKTFAKYFKSQNLINALKNITEKTHPIYIWKAEEHNEDSVVLDITDTYYSGNDSNAELSDDEHRTNSGKRKKIRRLKKRNVKSSSNINTSDKNSIQETDNTRISNESKNNNELELSQNVSSRKIQTQKPKRKIKSAPMTKKQQINTKAAVHNSKSKSQQTQLKFKSPPVKSVSISDNKNIKQKISNALMRTTVTSSTPMILRSIANKHQSIINSLEISPISQTNTAIINMKSP